MIDIAKHEELPSHGMGLPYRCWRFEGTVNGEPFAVQCEDGQYDYEVFPPSLEDDDEPLQIAIGEYMERHNIDPGKVHR